MPDLKTIYSALILPYLNYGLLACGGPLKPKSKYVAFNTGDSSNPIPYTLSNIYSLQKRAIRIVGKSKSLSHHIPLCSELQLLDLVDLYKISALSFFHDSYHHQLPPAFSHMFDFYYSKNNQLMIKTKYCRTDIASNTLLYTLPLIWNPLDVSLKKSNSKSKLYFIKQCKNYFINLYKSWYCDTPHCYFCRVYGGKMGSRGKMGNLRNSGNIYL